MNSLYFFWKHIFVIQYSLFHEYQDDFLNKPAQVIELEVMQSNELLKKLNANRKSFTLGISRARGIYLLQCKECYVGYLY